MLIIIILPVYTFGEYHIVNITFNIIEAIRNLLLNVKQFQDYQLTKLPIDLSKFFLSY